MKGWLGFALIILSSLSFAGAEELAGSYLGRDSLCGVEASIEGDNQLRLTIFDRRGEEKASERVPFQYLEDGADKLRFEYQKEYYADRGRTKIMVSGRIVKGSLRSVRIKKTYSFFNMSVASCSDITRLY